MSPELDRAHEELLRVELLWHRTQWTFLKAAGWLQLPDNRWTDSPEALVALSMSEAVERLKSQIYRERYPEAPAGQDPLAAVCYVCSQVLEAGVERRQAGDGTSRFRHITGSPLCRRLIGDLAGDLADDNQEVLASRLDSAKSIMRSALEAVRELGVEVECPFSLMSGDEALVALSHERLRFSLIREEFKEAVVLSASSLRANPDLADSTRAVAAKVASEAGPVPALAGDLEAPGRDAGEAHAS